MVLPLAGLAQKPIDGSLPDTADTIEESLGAGGIGNHVGKHDAADDDDEHIDDARAHVLILSRLVRWSGRWEPIPLWVPVL